MDKLNTIGGFYNLTASSLALIPTDEVIEYIAKLDLHQNRHKLKSLLLEVEYIRELQQSAQAEKSKTLDIKTIPARSKVEELIRGAATVLSRRKLVETMPASEKTDYFGEDTGTMVADTSDDLFGETEETNDLFGATEEDNTLFGETRDISDEQYSDTDSNVDYTDLRTYTAKQLIEEGSFSFVNMNEVMDMINELHEIEKYITAISARCSDHMIPVRTAYDTGVMRLPAKVLNAWTQFNYAVTNMELTSLYDFSVSELEHLVMLLDTEIPDNSLAEETDTKLTGIELAADMIYNMIISNTEHYAKILHTIEVKLGELGAHSTKILGVPLSSMHIALRGSKLINVAKVLQDRIKVADAREIYEIEAVLNELHIAKIYLQEVGKQVEYTPEMQQLSQYIQYVATHGVALNSLSDISPEIQMTVNEFLKHRLYQNINDWIQQYTTQGLERGFIQLLHMCKLKHFLTSEHFKDVFATALDASDIENVTFDILYQINEILITKYSMIPFSTDRMYLTMLYTDIDFSTNGQQQSYTDVIDSIDLLLLNFESSKSMRQEIAHTQYVSLG